MDVSSHALAQASITPHQFKSISFLAGQFCKLGRQFSLLLHMMGCTLFMSVKTVMSASQSAKELSCQSFTQQEAHSGGREAAWHRTAEDQVAKICDLTLKYTDQCVQKKPPEMRFDLNGSLLNLSLKQGGTAKLPEIVVDARSLFKECL